MISSSTNSRGPLWVATALGLSLAGCATHEPIRDSAGIPASPAARPAKSEATVAAARNKAIAAYREYLARYPDSPEHDRIIRRLADLLLEHSIADRLAREQNTGAPVSGDEWDPEPIRLAARHYEQLLGRTPDGPEAIEILYQLSRARSEIGENDKALAAIDRLLSLSPDTGTALYADTLFRKGELLFDARQFREAAEAYRALLALDADQPPREHILYKLGWSLFRQERHQEALQVMFRFLDLRFPPSTVPEARLESLPTAARIQTGDVLRVIGMSFPAQEGVPAVEDFLQRHDRQRYRGLVIGDLASRYERQDRVADAALAWRHLALMDPLGADSPRRLVRAIELCQQAGFRQTAGEMEALLALTYGVNRPFWRHHDRKDYPRVMQALHDSLTHLAQRHHEQARAGRDQDHYRAALYWYRNALASFPGGEDDFRLRFRVAELHEDMSLHRAALDAYERLALDERLHPYAGEAASGALRACDLLLPDADAEQRLLLADRMTNIVLHLATRFPDHPRAADLLGHGGRRLLELHLPGRALALGEHVSERLPETPTRLAGVAWSLRAQASFDLARYPEAAAAYRHALASPNLEAPRRKALQEGLAAAVHRQAETAFREGGLDIAQRLFLEAERLSTDPDLATNAGYGAATVLLMRESWPDAITILERIRNRHPEHPLQPEVTRKLAFARERDGDIEQAADEYRQLASDMEQSEDLRRSALLHAADLYDRGGHPTQAIQIREQYHDLFPEPVDMAIGNLQQLVKLRLSNGDADAADHWRGEIIRLDHAKGTENTRQAAAQAALALAEDRRAGFERMPLRAPLRKRLPGKVEAMKGTIRAYEAAIAYGITPVTTAATYRIAGLYEEMARALLVSERPAGLTDKARVEYESRLADQAVPFRERAMEIHALNARHATGVRPDPWVERSIRRLGAMQAVHGEAAEPGP